MEQANLFEGDSLPIPTAKSSKAAKLGSNNHHSKTSENIKKGCEAKLPKQRCKHKQKAITAENAIVQLELELASMIDIERSTSEHSPALDSRIDSNVMGLSNQFEKTSQEPMQQAERCTDDNSPQCPNRLAALVPSIDVSQTKTYLPPPLRALRAKSGSASETGAIGRLSDAGKPPWRQARQKTEKASQRGSGKGGKETQSKKRTRVRTSSSLMAQHLNDSLQLLDIDQANADSKKSVLPTEAMSLIKPSQNASGGHKSVVFGLERKGGGGGKKCRNISSVSSSLTPTLEDYLRLGFDLGLAPTPIPLAVDTSSASTTDESMQARAKLFVTENNNDLHLVFASPTLARALHQLIEEHGSLSQLKRKKSQSSPTVDVVDLTSVVNKTLASLVADASYITSHTGQDANRTQSIALCEVAPELKNEVIALISGGLLEAYFRCNKPIDKYRSLPARFRAAHYYLTDAQWNAVRIEPLRTRFDDLVRVSAIQKKITRRNPIDEGTAAAYGKDSA